MERNDDLNDTIAKNKALVGEYPFLKPAFMDEEMEKEYDYSWTEADLVCTGWRAMFMDLCEEIKRHLVEKGVDPSEFHFYDIKEKWGLLRLEACGYVDAEIDEMLSDAEFRSLLFCPSCGKPSKYVTRGYVLYVCPDCLAQSNLVGYPLTEDDVPYTTIYGENNEKTIKRSKYDDQFRAQWNAPRRKGDG